MKQQDKSKLEIHNGQVYATSEFLPHVVLSQHDGVPYVNSLQIAKHFRKSHKDVLRSIERLTSDLGLGQRKIAPTSEQSNDVRLLNFEESKPETIEIGGRQIPVEYFSIPREFTAEGRLEEFCRLNFEETYRTDRWNRQQQMYNLTRDGFALLAMGFTGKEALRWKVAYIQAFNAMEAELRRRQAKDGVLKQSSFFPPLESALSEQRAIMSVRDAVVLMHHSIGNLPPLGPDYIRNECKRGRIEHRRSEAGRIEIYIDSFNAWLNRRAALAA